MVKRFPLSSSPTVENILSTGTDDALLLKEFLALGNSPVPQKTISAILDFRGLIIGSLKSPCTTFYRSSIESIALNCLLFEKIAFCILATDRQTNGQTDGHHRCVKPPSRFRELRLNNTSTSSEWDQLVSIQSFA